MKSYQWILKFDSFILKFHKERVKCFNSSLLIYSNFICSVISATSLCNLDGVVFQANNFNILNDKLSEEFVNCRFKII